MFAPVGLAQFIFLAFYYLGISNAVDSVSTTVNPAVYQYICPSNFELVQGQCRGLAKKEGKGVNVSEALRMSIDVCSEVNSLLPIVRNDEESNYWRTKSMTYADGYLVVPIGIICDEKSKKWTWIDGSEISYRPYKFNAALNKDCTTDGVWAYFNNQDEWTYTASGTFYSPYHTYCMSDLKKPEIHENDCIQFEHDESDSMCCQVSDNVEIWSDAQKQCKMLGANLASIHNSQENAFIRRLAVSRGLVNGVYLGATVDETSNTFEWTDGSKWDYTNFFSGFPIPGIGDCLIMATGDSKGEWANTACTTKFPFVCSRKPFTDSPPKYCRGALIKEGDIVRTPGYPMDASTACDFLLQVDAGKLVEIEVVLLQANNCCDYLALYEGSIGYNLIANLTGAISGATFRTKSQNLMRASWNPNGGVNVRGAMFTFRGV